MNFLWKFDQWWKDLSVSLMAGTEALGVFQDKTGLTLAHVQQNLKGIQVEHVSQLLWDSGKIEDVTPAFQAKINDWHLESCPVALAVSADLGFRRRVVFPRATMENLSQVVAYELDRLLPLPADQLYYDFQIQAVTDTEVHLMLMALPRNRVEDCLNMFAKAGLRPVAVQLASLAAVNAFARSDQPMPGSWLLLHLESGAFELLHLKGGVVQGYEYGRDLERRVLSERLVNSLRSLMATEFRPQALAIYGCHDYDFQVEVLQQYDLEIIYPNHVSFLREFPEVNQDRVIPAAGIALMGIGKVLLGINLLPLSDRTSVKLSRFSATTLLLAVFLGLFILWGASYLIHTPVELYRLNREITKLAPEAQRVEALLNESRKMANEMGSLRRIGNSPDKLKILKDLTGLIPDNTWLVNLKLDKQNLELVGLSKSASDLIPLLDKSGWFDKTEFASPIVTDVNKLEHFKIKGEIKGLAPDS